MTLAAGARLGPYEIVAPIGAGGMGEVYRATDPRLDREVALKVLPGDFADDPDRLARLKREARAASALNHPNIVTIYEIGQEGGVAYIAMELVDGWTLREMLAQGPLETERLSEVGGQIAEGLAKAHAAGIVHRDQARERHGLQGQLRQDPGFWSRPAHVSDGRGRRRLPHGRRGGRGRDLLARCGGIPIPLGLTLLDALAPREKGIAADVVATLKERHRHQPHRYGARADGEKRERDERYAAEYRRLRLAMIAAEREEIVRLRDEDVISDAVMREVQSDLDLEQTLLET